jgi:hypothetical protein
VSVLSAYEPAFSSTFLEWVDATKDRLNAALTTVLLKIISEDRSSGRWELVESSARHLLHLTPGNEEAALALAESLAMRGAKLEGVRVLNSYLEEVGKGPTDLRLSASIMRKRIIDRVPIHEDSPLGGSVFVGRGESMSTLCSLLQEVRLGRGRTCLVLGEAGIGKSRLLAEFSAFAALQGVAVVRGRCRSNDPTRPLSVFVDLVPLLRGLRGAIGCSPETMKYLDRITHHAASEAPTSATPASDADFVYARVQQALFDLIDAVTEEAPLLVVIEDVHRLDSASGSLLSDIIPWSSDRQIFFAFTGREKTTQWADEVNGSIVELKLPPIDATSARELISATVRQHRRQIDEDDISWCVRVADGNPYFLVELASHWMETDERHAAPQSLSGVINQRLSRLDAPTLQLLQTCALLDNNATVDRIENVLGFQHHQLLQCINELGSLGMLVLDPPEAVGESQARLVPRHELLANAVQDMLTRPARAFLHRRIGTVLESEITGSYSAAILWDCAKHWQLAGNGSRAFLLARSCATHLMELGLCSAAAEAYEKSLSYCSTDAQRLEMLEGQATAQFRSSDWSRLSETAGKVRNLQRYLKPDENGHDEIELMDLRGLWLRGDVEPARSKALDCLASSQAPSRHRVRAGIMALMMLDLACDHDAMQRTYHTMRALLAQPGGGSNGSAPEEASIASALLLEAEMVYETACGNVQIGLTAAKSLIDIKRTSGSIADFMRALTNGSAAARTAGRTDLTKLWLEEALAIAASHKLPLASEVPLQILANVALDENNINDANRWYSALLQLPATTFDAITIRTAIGIRIALSRGDVEQARRFVHSDLQQLAGDPHPHRSTYGLALLMAVDLAEGKEPNPKTLEELEQSHLIARRNSRQAYATFILVGALRRAGRRERADQLLEEYSTLYRREPVPPPRHLLEMIERLPGCS